MTRTIDPVAEAIADVEGVFLLEKRSNAPHGNAPPTFNMSMAGYAGAGLNCRYRRTCPCRRGCCPC